MFISRAGQLLRMLLPQQSADLLRQRLVADMLTWAVVVAWEARAARVCCDTQGGGPRWRRLFDFPAA